MTRADTSKIAGLLRFFGVINDHREHFLDCRYGQRSPGNLLGFVGWPTINTLMGYAHITGQFTPYTEIKIKLKN